MTDQERDYCLQRAAEEEKAAAAATSLKARTVHQELAILYRKRALEGSPRRWQPVHDDWSAGERPAA